MYVCEGQETDYSYRIYKTYEVYRQKAILLTKIINILADTKMRQQPFVVFV
jgi:hypothetical protein